MARDYYDVLGVPRTASAEEIQQAFRKLVRRHHPDINKDPGAEERFKEINDAYSVLSDPKTRQRYDRFGENFRQIPEDYDERVAAGAGARGGWSAGVGGAGGGGGGRGGNVLGAARALRGNVRRGDAGLRERHGRSGPARGVGLREVDRVVARDAEEGPQGGIQAEGRVDADRRRDEEAQHRDARHDAAPEACTDERAEREAGGGERAGGPLGHEEGKRRAAEGMRAVDQVHGEHADGRAADGAHRRPQERAATPSAHENDHEEHRGHDVRDDRNSAVDDRQLPDLHGSTLEVGG